MLAAPTPTPNAPQPGMDRLEGLVAAVQGAGLAVDLHVDGLQRLLPAGVELSAYRIMQEALSNTLRHAPGASVTVEVNYQPDRLRLRVHNDRRPSAATAHRRPHQDTASLACGARRAAGRDAGGGTDPDGGYLVESVLPLDADHAERS